MIIIIISSSSSSINAAVSEFVNIAFRHFDRSLLVLTNRDEAKWLSIVFPHFHGIGQITLAQSSAVRHQLKGIAVGVQSLPYGTVQINFHSFRAF